MNRFRTAKDGRTSRILIITIVRHQYTSEISTPPPSVFIRFTFLRFTFYFFFFFLRFFVFNVESVADLYCPSCPRGTGNSVGYGLPPPLSDVILLTDKETFRDPGRFLAAVYAKSVTVYGNLIILLRPYRVPAGCCIVCVSGDSTGIIFAGNVLIGSHLPTRIV